MNEDNRIFRRGEAYWITLGSGIGVETGVNRPCVIVSSDAGNRTSPAVMVCPITTQPQRALSVNALVSIGSTPHTVECANLMMIDKSRVGKRMSILGSEDMDKVDAALAAALDLTLADDRYRDMQRKIVEGQKKLEENQAIIQSMRMEADMYKAMYETTMGQLAELQVGRDLDRRVTGFGVTPKPEKKPVVKPEPEPEQEPEKPEVNTCSESDLRRCGLTTAMARLIVRGRPYRTLEDMKKISSLSKAKYMVIAPKLRCVAPKVDGVVAVPKVNVNTATAKEISVMLGISMGAAYAITGKRNREGKFKTLEETIDEPRFSRRMLEAHKDQMCI